MKNLLFLLLLLPVTLFAQTNTDKADSLLKAGNANEAKKLYTKIIKKDPKVYKAYIGRANAYYDLKDYTLSVKDYTTAIGLKKDDPVAYGLRGGAWFMLKEYNKAIEDFTMLIRLDEKNSGYAYFMRGLCKSVLPQEDVEGACADFRKAKELGWDTGDMKGLNEYCNTTDLED